MAAIQRDIAPVFYAPTKNQRYLSAKTAADNEAKAKIKRKYPSERAEYDSSDGYCTDPGWHWSQDERLIRLHKRYVRLLLRALRKEKS